MSPSMLLRFRLICPKAADCSSLHQRTEAPITMTTELLPDVPIKMLLITRTKNFETRGSHMSLHRLLLSKAKQGPIYSHPDSYKYYKWINA